MTDTERDEIRKVEPAQDTPHHEGGAMDFIGDDENVKAMRETARTTGLTALLLDVRREHLAVQTALDRDRARVTKALELLGEEDKK